jgi:hypothetical protein
MVVTDVADIEAAVPPVKRLVNPFVTPLELVGAATPDDVLPVVVPDVLPVDPTPPPPPPPAPPPPVAAVCVLPVVEA